MFDLIESSMILLAVPLNSSGEVYAAGTIGRRPRRTYSILGLGKKTKTDRHKTGSHLSHKKYIYPYSPRSLLATVHSPLHFYYARMYNKKKREVFSSLFFTGFFRLRSYYHSSPVVAAAAV